MHIKKTKIIIAGAYGNKNSGDELILLGILNIIREKIPQANIVVFSYNVEHTEKNYNVKAFPLCPQNINYPSLTMLLKYSFWKYILLEVKQIQSCNCFILGGGGLLEHSYPGIAFWLSRLLLAQLLGKPTMIYALGVEVLNNRNFIKKIFLKSICNRINVITLRDTRSKENLIELGVDERSVRVTADPVFSFAKNTLKISQSKNVIEAEKSISICFIIRPLEYPWLNGKYNISKSQRNFNLILASSLDRLTKDFNCSFALLPMNYRDDIGILKDIQNNMEYKDSATIFRNDNIYENIFLLSKISFVISMRLHPLIMALLYNKPFIAIASHEKINKLLSDIDQIILGISINETNSKTIYDKFKFVISNRDNLMTNFKKISEKLFLKEALNCTLLQQLLKNNIN